LCFFTFVIGLGNIQAGFAISGNNQTAPVIKAKFGWTRDEATLYNTIISSSAIFGIVVGSLVGGNFITRGRRLALIVFNVFAAIAVTLTMFEHLVLICIGRFGFGFCCGVFSVAGPKMLDETVPIHLNSSFGTATNTFLSGGIMIAVVLGAILPDDYDLQGQRDDGNWRILYGFPYIC
jgi:facilitated trehalose transporter